MRRVHTKQRTVELAAQLTGTTTTKAVVPC